MTISISSAHHQDSTVYLFASCITHSNKNEKCRKSWKFNCSPKWQQKFLQVSVLSHIRVLYLPFCQISRKSGKSWINTFLDFWSQSKKIGKLFKCITNILNLEIFDVLQCCGPLPHTHTHTHTHTHLTVLCPGLPRWAGTRKVKPIWVLLKQETVSGSGISWAICKYAPCSRHITTPAPHHSVFTGRMPFLPPNQQCQSVLYHCAKIQ